MEKAGPFDCCFSYLRSGVKYNTIEKTYKAPYVTKKLFVGIGVNFYKAARFEPPTFQTPMLSIIVFVSYHLVLSFKGIHNGICNTQLYFTIR